MSADIWNSLAGYVIIKIVGLYPERVLNRLIQGGIEIWDVSRRGDSLRLSIGVGGFYRLRSIVREYPCRVRIMEKHGLTVALCHMGRRYVMAFGWIIVLGALLWASRFVWFIDIEGCSAVEEGEALNALREAGVGVGMRRGSLDTAAAAEAVMASDERIAWAGAELTGVVLQISVREAGENGPVHTPGVPCSVYAARSGIITSITALSGKPMFRAGDAVKAGETLITGDLGNGVFAQARGTVEAQVLHSLAYFAPRTQSLIRRTGRSGTAIGIELLGKTLLPPEPPYEACERDGEKRLRFAGILPITVRTVKYYEVAERTVQAGDGELREIAAGGAEEMLNAEMPRDAAIISKKTSFSAAEDGVVCTVRVVAEENIARAGEIQRNGTG